MKRVFNTCFLLFHLDFSRCTDFDHSNTACQLRNALLELLAIVVRGCVFDLYTDLANTALDCVRIASTINNGCVVFVHGDALRITEVLEASALEIETYFLRDNRTASQDSDVLQHGLTTIAEARCFTCSDFNDATHVVNNQCRQRLAFYIFSNDDEWARSLRYLLKNREKLADV